MVKLYISQNNTVEQISITKEAVAGLLKDNADGISTTSTNAGVRVETDGKGEHTKKLPQDLHHYIHETEGARFSEHRENTSKY